MNEPPNGRQKGSGKKHVYVYFSAEKAAIRASVFPLKPLGQKFGFARTDVPLLTVHSTGARFIELTKNGNRVFDS